MKFRNCITIFALIVIVLFGKFSYSQTSTIRGFVYEKATGEPVIFTNVYLQKTIYGSSTDVNGYFAISKVPAGSYNLTVSFMGYDTISIPISLKAGEVSTQKLFLQKSSKTLKELIVSAEKQDAKTETKTSVVKITPKQITSIPSVGGQPDLAQYLQVLPGVIFTGDQGGQLYIRGGSPVQNKVLLDGMVVYNPFHSIGLFSVFDTDLMRNADIYTGGFGAEYGGRISSIMDITTRDGNKRRYGGKIGVSPFGAKIMLEGPIKKQTEGKEGSSSFVFSAKNSYLKESSKIFYNYIDTAGIPFNYTDLFGKVSFNSSNGSKVSFFGFNFTDKVTNYKALSDFHWESSGAGANFVIIPGASSILVQGNIAYSTYKVSLEEENKDPRTSLINGFNLGMNFTYFLGKNDIKYGIEVLGFKTDFQFMNSINRTIQQTENTTEIGVYVKSKITKGKFLIEPSFRAHYYASLSELSPEPRLALKFNASDKIRIKLAAGMYSQNLISASSDRDVVNLFYGFLSGSDNIQENYNGKPVTSKLQKSDHLILGFESDLFKNITVNLEGYYKYFPQLTNLNRNKIFEDNGDNYLIPDYYKKDFVLETGDAEGIDLSLKYDYKRFYFWAVYSYGYIHRKDEITSYVPHYDRRHNVNLVGTVTLGDKYNWEINARWNMGSGFPFTQTQGNYEMINFDQGINTNYTNVNGDLTFLYGEANAGRLPYYHRLDLTIKRKFFLTENANMEAFVSVTNLYNRSNLFYVDRVKNEKIYQLPIMPSFGLNLTF
ncbi:MAG: carboxypeptidase-like regulatory domain-containing protein [Bacteroidetes bacterium]|nr:carboxypeptidase-like regulatory domain-containing protein [Bacteroidota bacterium]